MSLNPNTGIGETINSNFPTSRLSIAQRTQKRINKLMDKMQTLEGSTATETDQPRAAASASVTPTQQSANGEGELVSETEPHFPPKDGSDGSLSPLRLQFQGSAADSQVDSESGLTAEEKKHPNGSDPNFFRCVPYEPSEPCTCTPACHAPSYTGYIPPAVDRPPGGIRDWERTIRDWQAGRLPVQTYGFGNSQTNDEISSSNGWERATPNQNPWFDIDDDYDGDGDGRSWHSPLRHKTNYGLGSDEENKEEKERNGCGFLHERGVRHSRDTKDVNIKIDLRLGFDPLLRDAAIRGASEYRNGNGGNTDFLMSKLAETQDARKMETHVVVAAVAAGFASLLVGLAAGMAVRHSF